MRIFRHYGHTCSTSRDSRFHENDVDAFFRHSRVGGNPVHRVMQWGMGIIFLLAIAHFAHAASDDTIPTDYYQKFQDNVQSFCVAGTNSALPWTKNYTQFPLLKSAETIPYLQLDGLVDTSKVGSYISSIQSTADCSGSGGIMGSNIVAIEACVYRESMNALYGCAVINAKKKVLKHLKDIISQQQGNQDISRKVDRLIADVDKELKSGNRCADVSDGDTTDFFLDRVLLDNSMYLHCKYRYYLEYLDRTLTYDLSKAFIDKDNKPVPTFPASVPTDSVVQYLNSTQNQLEIEADRTRVVQQRALDAFGEFKRTYALHVMLVFIHAEYVELRKNMKALINPIGQVMYKISNAQNPRNG